MSNKVLGGTMDKQQQKEAVALGAREAFLALLETEETSFSPIEFEETLEGRQRQLCRSLLRSLDRLKTSGDNSTQGGRQGQFIRTSIADYNNKSEEASDDLMSSVSIREVLGNLPSATTSKLPAILSSFLAQRVDTDVLLPATQDDLANEEVMGSATAITLTKLNMVAAQLYVKLISMPGAWGAGMIDVGTISRLSALLRRWSVECRGREPDLLEKQENEASKRKSSATTKAPDMKRSRTRVVAVLDDDSELENSSFTESSDIEEEEERRETRFDCNNGSPLSNDELVVDGLLVASALGEVPCKKEFMNWSGEAREAFIDAVVSSLATSSALLSGQARMQKQEGSKRWIVLCRSVEFSLSNALQKWVLTSSDEIGDFESKRSNLNKHHDTSIYLMRGLLPYISMQTELPRNQRGKQAAHDIAVSTLEGFICCAASECSKSTWESRNHPTPRSTTTPLPRGSSKKNADNSVGVSTPFTSGKEGRKRVSFGGNDSEAVVPPTLKKTTPRRRYSRSSIGSNTPNLMGQQSRPILSAVVGLFQKLITSKGVEKANERASMISMILLCLPRLPVLEQSHFLRFVIQLCHSKISVHRLIGAELIGKVLSEKWLWANHAAPQISSPDALWSNSKTPSTRRGSLSPLVKSSDENMPFALIGALHGRLTDRVPAVRARAAFSLSDALRKFSDGEIMASGDESWVAFEQSINAIGYDMLDCLRTRAAGDERATVKKAAVSALVELLVLGETLAIVNDRNICIAETDVSILRGLCGDRSVATRKAAADALTALLQRCYYTGHCSIEAAVALEHAWSSAVLPLALDFESSCAAKALGLFSVVIVEPLSEVGGQHIEWDNESQKRRYMTAWRILAHVSENSRQRGAARGEAGSLRVVLKKRFGESNDDERNLVKSMLKEMHRVAVNTLETEDELTDSVTSPFGDDLEAQRIGVWCLLDAFVGFQEDNLQRLALSVKRSSIDMRFLVASWEALLEMSVSAAPPKHCVASLQESMCCCLRVLSKLASLVPEDGASRSIRRLKELLGSYGLAPDLIGSAISALVALTETNCSNAKKECSVWIKELYERCQSLVTTYLSNAQSGDRDSLDDEDVCLARALFTIGELSLVGFRTDEDSLSRVQKSSVSSSKSGSVVGLHEAPSKPLCDLVKTLLSKHLPATEGSGEEPILTPEAVRAHAFTALGKLCLRNEGLAKESLTILARELHESELSASVKSNALLVLGDLCVKYTNLVDRYLPVMAECLQSTSKSEGYIEVDEQLDNGSALVRRHAVLLISGLLLQDYLKWRGLMFHRFLVASIDDDEGVSQLTVMTLCGPLLQKYPRLFSNHFVEAIFVLNRCTAHPIYTSAAMTGENGGGVAVGFDGIMLNKAKRLQIYEMMLSNMTDEEKIGATARIAKDILGGALESSGDLSKVCRNPPQLLSPEGRKQDQVVRDRETSAMNVLSDAFEILTNPAIRVGKNSGEDDDFQDTEATRGSSVVAVKGKLLSNISRKHLVEILLPKLCNLKIILQENGSPLLKDLMGYLVDIFSGYKSEVVEFLANDPTLLQEVEFDANQFKKQARNRGTLSAERNLEEIAAEK